MPQHSIRTASFRRRGFNFIELEQWRKRTKVQQIFTISFTQERCRVTYR